MDRKRLGFAVRVGVVVGLLTAALLCVLYVVSKSVAVHPYGQQSVWVFYLIGMFVAAHRYLSGAYNADPHWLEAARPAFVVFLVANVFFYFTYWLGHRLDPQLESLQKAYYTSLLTNSVAEEDRAAARLQIEESDLTGVKTVLFNYARAAIGGFVVSALVGFTVLRLSPTKMSG